MACCVLHNICIDVGDPSAIDPVEDDDEMDQSSFNGDEQLCARNIRDDIMDHLSQYKRETKFIIFIGIFWFKLKTHGWIDWRSMYMD